MPFGNIVNSDTGRRDKHAVFLLSHTLRFLPKKKGRNTVTHGRRYCRLHFVVIEQEMDEKIGVTRRGGGWLERGR
jgi:hypothetical protein